jgi:hypothetical protein
MLRISLLQISAFRDPVNHQPYNFSLIQDHASQLTIHLLLRFQSNEIEFKISYFVVASNSSMIDYVNMFSIGTVALILFLISNRNIDKMWA